MPDSTAFSEQPVLFDAVLHPNRSLSPRGFRILMTSAAIFLLVIGTVFFLMGAWPVVGLLGLDILLLYWAFKANYKAGKTYETVRLTETELQIERRNHWGETHRWAFQPYWLKVRIKDPPDHDSQIELRSHGNRLIIGSFLSPPERADFARALNEALDRLRRPDFEASSSLQPYPAE